MTGLSTSELLRHALYLHRHDILDLQRERVTAFFNERLPGAALTLSDGSHDPLPAAGCLIAPAAEWVLAVIERLPGLGWVHFMGAGVDQVADSLRRRPELLVSNSAGVNSDAMSEFALAAIFYFAKELDRFTDQQRDHRWQRIWLSELAKRHLLILGAGSVARALARRARGLGMDVTAVARSGGRRDGLPRVVAIDRLPEVLPSADFLTCCLPLSDATRGLLGDPQLGALPPHAVLINLSRGGIVDEAALVSALREGRMRGAAMDVFAEEPLPPDSPLWDCPNLLITPHVAGTTDRYLARMLESFEANWRALEAYGRLATPVDLDRGY